MHYYIRGYAFCSNVDYSIHVIFQVLFKQQTNGMGNLVEMAKILTHLKLTKEKFTNMCIAAGCDYIENIRGIGIKQG